MRMMLLLMLMMRSMRRRRRRGRRRVTMVMVNCRGDVPQIWVLGLGFRASGVWR